MAGIIFSILFAMATGVWFYFLNKKAKKIHHNIALMNNELEGKKTTYKDIEDLIAKGKEKIDELTKEQDELLQIVKEVPSISRAALSKKLNISERQVRKIIDRLKEDGVLTRQGGNSGSWIVNKE